MLTPTLDDVTSILALSLGGKQVHSGENITFPDLNYVFGMDGGCYSTFLDANFKVLCEVVTPPFLMPISKPYSTSLASSSMAPALWLLSKNYKSLSPCYYPISLILEVPFYG